MAKRSSSFNQPSSSSMVVNAGVWENEETTVKRPDLLTTVSQRTKPLLLFPEESHADSHVVPDEDDIYEPHHSHDHYSQVAPRVARKINLFDLEKPPAAVVYNMINSKSFEAADYKDLMVPHHHDDCELFDSKHPDSKAAIASDKHANEAEAEAALVPSLSVCSNDPHPASTRHPDQYQFQSPHYEQALARKIGASQVRTPAKRKHARARAMEKQRVKINKKMRTLQGLIPNCNDKVDKASILDEAIVYVKALQLQLQMMSMPPMHLSYLPATPAAGPPFPMLGFPSFVPLAPQLLVSHPSISLSNSINSNLSNHLLQHHQQ